jgi:23S rRNA (cytidine1920-2'-O)/16S rRNA (cytidine1409-2'-O)-methyltransferase
VAKVRLDVLLVDRGLAASRERARALILAGQVRVGGQVASKAGQPVASDTDVTVAVADHPYVGRGGLKLAHALDAFAVDCTGRTALDIGASTGGFTDVLLRRGARLVVALDVGHNQLDYRLRTDPRVRVVEGVNARHLHDEHLPPDARVFDLVTIDVAFISLRHVLPSVPPRLASAAEVITLVKPQFEAGRDEVGKGGIVTDETVHQRVIRDIIAVAEALGFEARGVVDSPVRGAEGNREFLLHLWWTGVVR